VARQNDGGTFDFFLQNTTGAPVTAMPLSMSCLFYPNNAQSSYLIDIDDTGDTENGFVLWINASSHVLARQSSGGSGFTEAETSATYSTSTWQHAGAVFTSTTSRTAYLNGANAVNDTTSLVAPSGVNRITVGRVPTSGFGNMFGGIAEVAIWNVALTAAEMLVLNPASGMFVSPLAVRPSGLVFYSRLMGQASPEIDRMRGLNLTVNSGVRFDHPGLVNTYPRAVTVPTAAAAGVTLPQLERFHPRGLHRGMYP